MGNSSRKRNVSVIRDANGNNIVMINDIILKGANEKAKANAAQGLPELINTATNVAFTENSKIKHQKDALYGWYKYESRFALPIFGNDGEVERYNVYHAAMIFRHAKDGKKYLYDIMNIKKETSNLFQSEDFTQ